MLPYRKLCNKTKMSGWKDQAVLILLKVCFLLAFLLVLVLPGCSNMRVQTASSPDSPSVTALNGERETADPISTGRTPLPQTSIPVLTPSAAVSDRMITSASAKDMQQLRKIRLGIPGSLNAIVSSPDGTLLAAAGEGGVVIFDAVSLEIIRELDSEARFDHLSFSASGAALVGAGFDLTVQVWDVVSGETRLILHEAGELAALSPNGMNLVTVRDVLDDDGVVVVSEICVYELKSGKKPFSLDYSSRMEDWNPILPLTLGLFYSPDGKKIFSVNVLGDIRVIDAMSGELLSTYLNEKTRSRFSTGYCEVDENGAASFVVACNQYFLDPPCNEDEIGCMPESHRRTVIEVWNAVQGVRSFQRVFTDPPEDFLGMVYDGKTMHLGLQYANHMQFWDISQTIRELNLLEGDEQTLWSGSGEYCTQNPPGCGTADFSLRQNDEKDILTAAYGVVIETRDIQAGVLLSSFASDGRKISSAALGLWQSSPVLALGLSDGTVRLERLADGSVMEEFQAHEDRVTDVSFSGSGQYLVTGGQDGVLRLWHGSPAINDRTLAYSSYYGFVMDAAGKHMVMQNSNHVAALFTMPDVTQTLALADDYSKPLAISADGHWLAMPHGESHATGVWSLADGSFLRMFPLPDGETAGSLALSPDGSLLAAGGENILQVWRINDTGVWQQQEFEAAVSSLAFSPNGCLLALGDVYGRVYLYDVVMGEVVWQQKAHSGSVQRLSFREDGVLLLSLGREGSIAVWGLEDGLQAPVAAPPVVGCLSSLPLTSTPLTPTVTATVTPTATPVLFERQLYLMEPQMVGEDVRQVQACLLELGFEEVGMPDGIFGKMTDAAVRAFQEERGLVVDGVVGELTWTELMGE